MQSNAFFESNKNKTELYTQSEFMTIFFFYVSTLGFNRICKSIKSKFSINFKSCYVNIIADIILSKRHIIVITSTSVGKSLVYQSILYITRNSDLVISLMIALIKD